MTPSPKQSTVREQVTEAEWKARVDLAAAYRLVALHGWDNFASMLTGWKRHPEYTPSQEAR